MTHPDAYAPKQGYTHQILTRTSGVTQPVWEHHMYAVGKAEAVEAVQLLIEWCGMDRCDIKRIRLPRKYWPHNK